MMDFPTVTLSLYHAFYLRNLRKQMTGQWKEIPTRGQRGTRLPITQANMNGCRRLEKAMLSTPNRPHLTITRPFVDTHSKCTAFL